MPQIRPKNLNAIHKTFVNIIEDWTDLRKFTLDLYVWRWGNKHQLLLGEYTDVRSRLMDIGFCFSRLKYLSPDTFITLAELAYVVRVQPSNDLTDWYRFLLSRHHLIQASTQQEQTLLQLLLEGRPQVHDIVHNIQNENQLEIWALQRTCTIDSLDVIPAILSSYQIDEFYWLNEEHILTFMDNTIKIVDLKLNQTKIEWIEESNGKLHPTHPWDKDGSTLNLYFEDDAELSLQLPTTLQQMVVDTSTSTQPQKCDTLPDNVNFYRNIGQIGWYGEVYHFGQYYFSTDADGAIRVHDTVTGKNQMLLLGSYFTWLCGAYKDRIAVTVETQPDAIYIIDFPELFKLDDSVEGWSLLNGSLEPLERSINSTAEGLLIPDKNKVVLVSWNGVVGTTEEVELTYYALNEKLEFQFVNTAFGHGWHPLTAFSVYKDDIISVNDELGHELLWYGMDNEDGLYKAYLFDNVGPSTFCHYLDDYEELNIRAHSLNIHHEILHSQEGMISIANTKHVTEFEWLTDREVTFCNFIDDDKIVVVFDEIPKIIRLYSPNTVNT